MIILSDSVGEGGANNRADVDLVRRRLRQIEFFYGEASGEYTVDVGRAIKSFQSVFLTAPDGKIDRNGFSLRLLNRWSVKPVSEGVTMNQSLQVAWDMINPPMPAGAHLLSAIRTSEKQRSLLVDFFTGSKKSDIIFIYSQKEYDRVLALPPGAARDKAMHGMVNAAGQAIALPGTSKHELGKALDIAGPDPVEKERTARFVVRAHREIFSGKIIREQNGCVHVEIV